MKSDRVKEAFETIKQAMIDDNPSEPGSYAHGWHCNIAMCCYDSLNGTTQWRHKVSNQAASRFMKLCFDVETQGE